MSLSRKSGPKAQADAASRSRAEVALGNAIRSAAEPRPRVTANRRRVLECILDSDRPVSAYAVLRRLRAEHPKAAPLSVYRALDFLLRHGLIDRIELLNAYVARRDGGQDSDRQLLVCTVCGQVDEFHDDAIAARLRQHSSEHGFRIERQVVELSGICTHCERASLGRPNAN
jgi:Fur family transcriptional regulator, zinc uptake regulator